MQKLSLSLSFLLILFTPLVAQKAISLDDCFSYFRFYPRSAGDLRFAPDGKHYLEAQKEGIALVRIDSGEPADVLAPAAVLEKMEDWDGYTFTQDLSTVLFRGKSRPVYRHSVLAAYWVYDRKSDKLEKVHPSDELQFAVLSPDGSKVAFVLENNLFVKEVGNGNIRQVTRDGLQNQIINGLPDWVYEEEFSPVEGEGMVATVWSPDSRKLGFIRFDESGVPDIPLTWYRGETYPDYTSFKYPKVGENNSLVSVHIYDAEQEQMVGRLMNLEIDDYVPRLNWTRDNRLVVHRLNRAQDTLELLVAMENRVFQDDETGENLIPPRLLWLETDTAYVDIHDNLYFLEDGEHYIWASERDGFNHLYLQRIDKSAEPVLLTPGQFDVTVYYGIEETRGKFYFQTATPTPMDRQIWEGDLKGAAPRLLTPGPGTHTADFSPDFSRYLYTWEDANTPGSSVIKSITGDTLRSLLDNKRIERIRKEFGFVDKTFWSFERPDQTPLNGWMLKPDSLVPGKKYPVLFDVYGGPGSQTVVNEYDGYLDGWRQMLVQKGIIVVSVDNRGTGARGRDFKKCTQLQLGKLETDDQIAAARYLSTLSYVDSSRIGIWGWSYGGYLSTSCILKGNSVFKMAMAVAPVTNWKWYDTAYTERYMRTTRNNAGGYEENSPVNFAHLLHGDNYLICHGMADDNVHYQQTAEMINALIGAGKQFDTYYYPNRNHGIYGENATKHLFAKLTAFVMGKL